MIQPDLFVLSGIPICLKVALKSQEEFLWPDLSPVRLVFIEHNGVLRILPGSVKPHVALGLSIFSRLAENLKHGFIGMQVFTQNKLHLLEYGLGKYDVDFHDAAANEVFHLWAKYRKEQVQQLLLNNPKDIMLGTKIYDEIVYAYVTVIKSNSTADNLKYADGYIDADTFQWETVANVSERELSALKDSRGIHIFVRKVDNEDGIQLPFTYIGMGKMEYIEGSKKANGAHLFRIPMEATAPENIYFDFKLPE